MLASPRSFIALAAVVGALLVGCAGIHEYTTGVPARDSARFYAAIQSAAEQHGHKAWQSHDGGVQVEVAGSGSLMYSTQQGVIVVRTFPSRGGSDAQIEERARILRGEHDQLIAAARSDAMANKAFAEP
ncbi:MAG: hypothetical protein U1F43_34330 [Myxococcota bacterium]